LDRTTRPNGRVLDRLADPHRRHVGLLAVESRADGRLDGEVEVADEDLPDARLGHLDGNDLEVVRLRDVCGLERGTTRRLFIGSSPLDMSRRECILELTSCRAAADAQDRRDPMYTALFAMYRKDGLSPEEFVAHYRDTHILITRRVAGLRQYDVFPVEGAEGPDAFAVMAFDSAHDFQAILDTEEFKEAMADSETFVSRTDSYVVGHIPVVGAVGAVEA
jgi:uncharacterized protein (TIGR02118 family)